MSDLSARDEGPVRIITFERPEVRNALGATLRRELMSALSEAEEAPSVRVVVLTGSGSAFCSGMDLAELEGLLDKDLAEHLEDSRNLAALFARIYEFPKPVIAALNGHAIAGGAGIASVSDIIIASAEARIGYTEARIGFVAALVSVYLTRMVGERAARELLLEAKPVSASRALDYGLVTEVVPADQVMAKALERARSLAECSPNAQATTKRLLAASGRLSMAEALELAVETNARVRSDAEMREGVRAFLEKRPPSWQPDSSG